MLETKIEPGFFPFRKQIWTRFMSPEHELQEVFCFTQSFFWGLLLLIFTIFFKKEPESLSIVRVWNTEVWGMLLTFFGIMGAWAYWKKNGELRRLLAMTGVVAWTMLCWFRFQNFRPVIGSISMPLSALLSLVSYVRIGNEIRSKAALEDFDARKTC